LLIVLVSHHPHSRSADDYDLLELVRQIPVTEMPLPVRNKR